MPWFLIINDPDEDELTDEDLDNVAGGAPPPPPGED